MDNNFAKLIMMFQRRRTDMKSNDDIITTNSVYIVHRNRNKNYDSSKKKYLCIFVPFIIVSMLYYYHQGYDTSTILMNTLTMVGVTTSNTTRSDNIHNIDSSTMKANPNNIETKDNSQTNEKILYEPSIILKQKEKFPHLALVFEGGCTGSTAVSRFIKEIIIGHGLQQFDKGGFEFLNINAKWRKGKKHPFYHDVKEKKDFQRKDEEAIIVETVKIAGIEANESRKLFYFKINEKKMNIYRKSFEELGVNFVGVYRENVIDRCICSTNDCFNKEAGYPVFKDSGIKTSLCFSRRNKEEIKIVPHFIDPIPCFEESMQKQSTIKAVDFPSVSTESLFAFQYSDDDDAWNLSIEAWMTILRPFLSEVLNKSLLQESLKKYRGSRQAPRPHSELVYNFDYLKSQVENTKWAMYLRE